MTSTHEIDAQIARGIAELESMTFEVERMQPEPVTGTVTVHAGYPHESGTLHGCLACETNCYCHADEFLCLRCSVEYGVTE